MDVTALRLLFLTFPAPSPSSRGRRRRAWQEDLAPLAGRGVLLGALQAWRVGAEHKDIVEEGAGVQMDGALRAGRGHTVPAQHAPHHPGQYTVGQNKSVPGAVKSAPNSMWI